MIKSFLIDRAANVESIEQEYVLDGTVVFGGSIDLSAQYILQFKLNVPDWGLLTDNAMGLFTLGTGSNRMSMMITDNGNYYYIQIGSLPGTYFLIPSKNASQTILIEVRLVGSDQYVIYVLHGGSVILPVYRSPTYFGQDSGNGLLGDFVDTLSNPIIKMWHDVSMDNIVITDIATTNQRHRWLGNGNWNDLVGGADGTYGGTYEQQSTFTIQRNYDDEFVLEWFGRKAEFYQYLFTDWENVRATSAVIINEKNTNIRNIGIDESNVIELYLDDVSRNDLDYLSSLMVAPKIRRVKKSSLEYYTIMPGSFQYKQSGLRFNVKFRIMKQKNNYV